MKIKSYLKDKLLLITLLILSIVMVEILLLVYKIDLSIRIIIAIIPILLTSIAFVVEYNKKKVFYNKLTQEIQELNEKYLISELTVMPNFLEGKILKETLEETGKSMLENVNKYKYLQEDYKEYIELWIHEIKLPIAASKMVIENNKNKITKSIEEELDNVNNTILKNKNILISSKVNLDLHDLERQVYTDSKWAIFIINQIIQNSIKYLKDENKKIEIYAKEQKENVILYIKDNGIGIKKGEITIVFEKGFTGENGRITEKKSTGIGLYLCKKLCDKLGLGLELNSEKDVGTEVRVVFPKGSYINL